MCRTEHVAGGVKAQGDTVVRQALAVGEGLQVDVLPQTRAQNPFAGAAGQIMLVTGTGMIAVGMGNDRALDGAPRVYVEISGRAVQTLGAGDNKVHVLTRMGAC